MKLHYQTYCVQLPNNGIHKHTLCGKDSVEYNGQKIHLWTAKTPAGVTCESCKRVAKEISN